LADATMEVPVVEQPVKAPDVPDPTSPPAESASKPKKEKKDKPKGKGKEKKGAEPASADGPSVAAHPRAARAVATAKGWGGLIGFAAGGYLSLPTHTLADAGLRALVAGLACYVAAWAGAVFVWRRLVMLEIKAREQHLLNMIKARSAGAQGSPASGGRAGSPS
jgi:predicted lipid-binding transport protein (Tim44 family)